MKYEPKTTTKDRNKALVYGYGYAKDTASKVLADLAHAETVLQWQAKEIDRLKEQLRLSCVDSCCTDDDVRAEAKKVLPIAMVDGDDHCVPNVTEIVCMLVSEIQRMKETP